MKEIAKELCPKVPSFRLCSEVGSLDLALNGPGQYKSEDGADTLAVNKADCWLHRDCDEEDKRSTLLRWLHDSENESGESCAMPC